MDRKAQAVWRGTGKDGEGRLTSASGVLSDTAYSFKTRFENEKGTNPEELIAAAHAGCFAMACALASLADARSSSQRTSSSFSFDTRVSCTGCVSPNSRRAIAVAELVSAGAAGAAVSARAGEHSAVCAL